LQSLRRGPALLRLSRGCRGGQSFIAVYHPSAHNMCYNLRFLFATSRL
jgi:hypothetical protein